MVSRERDCLVMNVYTTRQQLSNRRLVLLYTSQLDLSFMSQKWGFQNAPLQFLRFSWVRNGVVGLTSMIKLKDEKSKSGISIHYVSKLILSSYIANTETLLEPFS